MSFSSPIYLSVEKFIQQIFIEHLLYTNYCKAGESGFKDRDVMFVKLAASVCKGGQYFNYQDTNKLFEESSYIRPTQWTVFFPTCLFVSPRDPRGL